MTTACAADLSRLEEELGRELPGAAGATRRASLLYRRACLTGRVEAYREADRMLDDALDVHDGWPDLRLLKATLDLHFHRFGEARRNVAALPGVAESPEGRLLLADVDLHTGNVLAAWAGFEAAASANTGPDVLVRLAGMEEAAGRDEAAERLYARAEEELTAKQMRSFAWLQLQRGARAVATGDFARAERLYDRADAAYSGYWLVLAHRGALATARGDLPAATRAYEELCGSTGRPEFEHHLGDVCLRAGDVERARACHDRALAGYRASVELGEVHELNRLAVLYLEVRGDATTALGWAFADLELRRSPLSLRTAARCLDAAGRRAEAERLRDEADVLSAPLAAASTS